MTAAGGLPTGRRAAFLESVAAELRGRITDSALTAAVHAALRDVVETPAA
jgi:hypothetical protein